MFFYTPGQGAVKLQNIIAVVPCAAYYDEDDKSEVYLTDGSKLGLKLTVEEVLQMIKEVLGVDSIVAAPKASIIVPEIIVPETKIATAGDGTYTMPITHKY